MNIQDLKELYDYSCWANNKLSLVIATLSNEDFTRSVAGSYGSIRNTLVHMISAEWGWLSRCGGEARTSRLSNEDFPDFMTLEQTQGLVEQYMKKFLSSLNNEDFERQVTYDSSAGEKRVMPVGELIHHVTNHNAHHRGQVSLLLRLLGHSPGNYDILFYYAEKRGVSAW